MPAEPVLVEWKTRIRDNSWILDTRSWNYLGMPSSLHRGSNKYGVAEKRHRCTNMYKLKAKCQPPKKK